MNYNAGVYKDTTGHFGYLNTNSNFVPNISRKQAREYAKSEGNSTTLKGIYIPEEKAEVKPKRAYRKYSLKKVIPNTTRGDILAEVSQDEFYNTYQTFLMASRNNSRIVKGKYLYGKTGTGTIAFVRW